MYKSKTQPNTTVTKIKSKPTSDGKVKQTEIRKTKLPDGKKTKTKSVTKTPGGGQKTKKKTVVASAHKNATKVTSIHEGKNGVKTHKTKVNETKLTRHGKEAKKIEKKLKKSPGKVKFSLNESKKISGPNKKKIVNKSEKKETSKKKSKNA